MDLNVSVNNYDKFAEKRHFEITSGKRYSIRFSERPMMKSMMPNISDKKVLLLGCGTGQESELLEKYNPQKIVGIDLSEKSIEIARKSYPNCEFYLADMLNLPFDDNEFDFVYSSLALNHIEDTDRLFKEIYRVLNNDGRLLFSVGHPMRFANKAINYNDKVYYVIGYESVSNGEGKELLGNYLSHKKQINYFPDNEVIEELIAPPSYYFEKLLNNNYIVENFKESKCIEECKEVDELYYNRFSEIPQFMGFLANKVCTK